MADLLPIRFSHSELLVPFSYVDLDDIGPFTVVRKRKYKKPTSALFDCLVKRAINSEVTEDLTRTCISAIRRSICFLGQPTFLTY